MAIIGIQKNVSRVDFLGSQAISRLNHVDVGRSDSFQPIAAPQFAGKKTVLGLALSALLLTATGCFNSPKGGNHSKPKEEGKVITTLKYKNNEESNLGPKGPYLIEFIQKPDSTIVAQVKNIIGNTINTIQLDSATPGMKGDKLISLFTNTVGINSSAVASDP